jgi:hypothetical protein
MAASKITNKLNCDAEEALFSNKVDGLVLACYQNERPLLGLIGLLDWRFHGGLSQFIREGALSAEEGHCTYCPIQYQKKNYHLLVVGLGYNPQAGKRTRPQASALKALKKNLASLKSLKFGLSQKDFGFRNDEDIFAPLQSEIQENHLWIVE